MKRIVKFSLVGVLLCGSLLLAAPFLLVQFGPPGMAAASRALLHAAIGYSKPSSAEVAQTLQLPAGYHLQVYADELGNVRMMAGTAAGDILVSRPRSGEVLLLSRDADGDGRADGRRSLLANLNRPQGLALRDGWLYIAESDAVGKIAFDEVSGTTAGSYQRIVEGLGDSGNHSTKSLAFGPDGWLYLSSGSSCNVCEEQDPQRATMMRLRADGSGLEIVARGLRNSVGFDWAPWDGAMYATDNGRDLLGDDFPPCELNRIERGGFYGWPYINSDRLDPDFGDKLPPELPENRPPVHAFRAHNAPLGIRFLRHQGKAYERAALVALHGSWNRSEPDGYKVVSLHWQADGRIVERDFLSGFLRSRLLVGRPVDVIEAADGGIYVSDDYAGRVYLIREGDGAGSVVESSQPPALLAPSEALAAYQDAEIEQLSRQGRALYQRYQCAACHEGDSGRRLQDLASRYRAAELADFFVSPTPPMPQFPLVEKEREALAVYLLDVVN